MHFVRDRRERTDREGKTICKKRWEHTMAPCMVIGEQAAALLQGDNILEETVRPHPLQPPVTRQRQSALAPPSTRSSLPRS